MKLVMQPFGNQNVGDMISNLLLSGDYNTFDFIVAFAKLKGVMGLKDGISRFKDKGGMIRSYVGIDLNGTSFEALINLHAMADELYVVHVEDSQTFHPKMYRFKGTQKTAFIIGSNNLTYGGLWKNIETSIFVEGNCNDKDIIALDNEFMDYINQLKTLGQSCLQITQSNQIDDLLNRHYIAKEAESDLRKKVSNGNNLNKLFGSSIPYKRPLKYGSITTNTAKTNISVSPSFKGITTTPTTNLDYFWIESRALTGGSRNILDLSKKSLLEKGNASGTALDMNDSQYIRGAVAFFGLDPMNEQVQENITINFLGDDYRDNTILYPTGARANGTWRLQLKGINKNGEEITEKFSKLANGGYYLPNKILVFYKIDDSYYELSVFDSNTISSFVNCSIILARNGLSKNSKQIGFY